VSGKEFRFKSEWTLADLNILGQFVGKVSNVLLDFYKKVDTSCLDIQNLNEWSYRRHVETIEAKLKFVRCPKRVCLIRHILDRVSREVQPVYDQFENSLTHSDLNEMNILYNGHDIDELKVSDLSLID